MPEEYITGTNGKRNVDYAIHKKGSGIVGVTEVKREDFNQGVAQNVVQMESLISRRKRGAAELGETCFRSFGIVTDAEGWVFLECTHDENGKPIFKLSKKIHRGIWEAIHGRGYQRGP